MVCLLDSKRNDSAGKRRTNRGKSQTLVARVFARQLLVLRVTLRRLSEVRNGVRHPHLLREQQQNGEGNLEQDGAYLHGLHGSCLLETLQLDD